MLTSVIKPDLSVVAIGVNEGPAVAPATYEANMIKLVDGLLVNGDVLLVLQPGRAGSTNQAAARASLVSIASTRPRVPICDLNAVFGGYSGGLTKGWYYDDPHPNYVGYSNWAATEVPFILPPLNP